jgi:hypothetical protein
MENPETWNKIQKVIAEAIDDHEKALQSQICGVSLVSRIYNKLLKNGMLLKENEKASF